MMLQSITVAVAVMALICFIRRMKMNRRMERNAMKAVSDQR